MSQRLATFVVRMQVGDELETVLVGSLLGNLLRIWIGNGQAKTLRLRESSEFKGLLASGVIARMSPESERFREVLLLEKRSHTLAALDRRPLRTEETSVGVGMTSVAFEEVDEPAPSDRLWRAAAELFGRAFLSAALRGEFLVSERGAW
jgi:hypothetical protein